jgi:UDP-glucose 4-epimerase
MIFTKFTIHTMKTMKPSFAMPLARQVGMRFLCPAEAGLAKELLGFCCEYSLENCIRSAWNWERNRKF